jgi:hypothetical protein
VLFLSLLWRFISAEMGRLSVQRADKRVKYPVIFSALGYPVLCGNGAPFFFTYFDKGILL